METRGELMRHALGVQSYYYKRGGERWKKPNRNRFVGESEIWRALVVEGFAQCVSEGNEITGGEPVFIVTDEGRVRALAGIVFRRTWGYGEPVLI